MYPRSTPHAWEDRALHHARHCLPWCLSDFHNTDSLRYHLTHSPVREHGSNTVYEYGSGTKGSRIKGHSRAPVVRPSDKLSWNRKPAALPSLMKNSTGWPLALRLLLAPDLDWSSRLKTRDSGGPFACGFPGGACTPSPRVVTPAEEPWPTCVFVEEPSPDVWAVPSTLWQYMPNTRVWTFRLTGSRCWKFFREISLGVAWSHNMWRLSAFLRHTDCCRS